MPGWSTWRALKSLEWLDLSSTEVSDAGLVHLEGLKSLRTLPLQTTYVTDAGIKRIYGRPSPGPSDQIDQETGDEGNYLRQNRHLVIVNALMIGRGHSSGERALLRSESGPSLDPDHSSCSSQAQAEQRWDRS